MVHKTVFMQDRPVITSITEDQTRDKRNEAVRLSYLKKSLSPQRNIVLNGQNCKNPFEMLGVIMK